MHFQRQPIHALSSSERKTIKTLIEGGLPTARDVNLWNDVLTVALYLYDSGAAELNTLRLVWSDISTNTGMHF